MALSPPKFFLKNYKDECTKTGQCSLQDNCMLTYSLHSLVMCYSKNGKRAGLTEIQISMLGVINTSLLVECFCLIYCVILVATHNTCTHLYTIDHWIYQHKTYIVFYSRLDYRAIDFLG